MKYTAVVLVTFGAEWLRMDRDERDLFNAEHIAPVFARYAGRVDMQHVDVEAFSGTCSDVLIFTMNQPVDFHDLWDELRDTPLFARPVLTVEDIVFGVNAEWIELSGVESDEAIASSA